MIPWIRIAIIVGALAAIGGVLTWTHHKGYVSGKDEVQAKWDAEKAALILSAQIKADQQRKDFQEKQDEYEKRIAELQAVPSTVVHDRIVSYVRGLCPDAGSSAGMPTGSAVGAGGSPANPAVRSGMASAADQIQLNIINAQRNKAQLMLCQDFIVTHGGGKP